MTEASVQLVHELESWAAPNAQQESLRRQYLTFAGDLGGAALRRDGGAAHVTASCFIFSTDLRHTLLCFHRKGHFWVQPGGHIEPADASVPSAALREAREETGLAAPSQVSGLLDLDRHALSADFGSCRTHWDVGLAALATTDELLQVSEESEQVAWFRIDSLPSPLASRVARRLLKLREALRAA